MGHAYPYRWMSKAAWRLVLRSGELATVESVKRAPGSNACLKCYCQECLFKTRERVRVYAAYTLYGPSSVVGVMRIADEDFTSCAYSLLGNAAHSRVTGARGYLVSAPGFGAFFQTKNEAVAAVKKRGGFVHG